MLHYIEENVLGLEPQMGSLRLKTASVAPFPKSLSLEMYFSFYNPGQGVHYRRSVSGEESRAGPCQCGGGSV